MYPLLLLGGVLLLGGGRYALKLLQKAKVGGMNFDLTSARAKRYSGPFDNPMTRREAYLILGARESTPDDKILTAHKKLMLLNHPDNGGSTYLATKINEAKEVILKR